MKVKRINQSYRCSTGKVVRMMQDQNGKCFYCYNKFNVDDKYLKPTIDHIHATSTGGSETDENNVVLACFKCNQKKGNISVQKFLDGYVCWNVTGRMQGNDDLQTISVEKKVRGSRKWYHKIIGYSL